MLLISFILDNDKNETRSLVVFEDALRLYLTHCPDQNDIDELSTIIEEYRNPSSHEKAKG